ncbi:MULTISPECIES: hypothetical protein [Actinoplanes]|uniref:hypothetical protein n=1 Tax=Actinoplanes TaxID=1865 RepID=UPI0005F2B14C|nr:MULTISPECIES: hypothetical protein [Actinoplanes]GLY02243.1 hypothetical protein Acsp01_26220 [Actinoplanes sp. NBRC 101535]
MNDTTNHLVFTGEHMGWRRGDGDEWIGFYPRNGTEVIHAYRSGDVTALSVGVGDGREPEVLVGVPWEVDMQVELADHVEEAITRLTGDGHPSSEPLELLLDQIAEWRGSSAAPEPAARIGSS